MGPCEVVRTPVECAHRGREPPRGCVSHGLTHELGRDQVSLVKVSPDQGWFPIFSNQRSFCSHGPPRLPPWFGPDCAIQFSNTTDRRRIPATPATGLICGDFRESPAVKARFPHMRTNRGGMPDGPYGTRSVVVPVLDTCNGSVARSVPNDRNE